MHRTSNTAANPVLTPITSFPSHRLQKPPSRPAPASSESSPVAAALPGVDYAISIVVRQAGPCPPDTYTLHLRRPEHVQECRIQGAAGARRGRRARGDRRDSAWCHQDLPPRAAPLSDRLGRFRFGAGTAIVDGEVRDSRPVPSTRDTKARDPVVRPPLQGAPEDAAPEPTGGESPPTSIRLDDPTPLLSWMTRNHGGVFSHATLKRFEVWGVVATATLARTESSRPLALTDYDRSAAGKFAHAIGSEDLVRGVGPARSW